MNPSLTNVFRRNAEAYLAGEKLIINQGGQGSSKTWSILQLFYILAKFHYPKESLKFTICSNSMPHLKLGAIDYFKKILLSFGENPEAIHHGTDHYFRVGKSIIEYFGIRDTSEKTLGPRRDFLFINEINNKVEYDDFDFLYGRTHICAFVDFNPRCRFWMHEQVMPQFKNTLIKSNYLDNLNYIPENELANILWKKDKPQFANWWKVFGEGELGMLEGQIFQNWTTGEFDEDLLYMFGLDFGFNPDPDSLIKIAIDRKNKRMYWDECFYLNRLGQSELREQLKKHTGKNELIVADCSENRLIFDLQADFNIRPVKKTGTVAQWLRLMQDYQHIITERSYNLEKEFNNYSWSDKRAGIPIDAFNHLIDGGRYCFMEQCTSGQGAIIGMRSF